MILDVIKTDRLVLRALRAEDAPALAEAANDYDIARWLARMPHPYRLEDAHAFIAMLQKAPRATYGIFHNDAFIGMVGTDGLHGLGYWLARSAWGKGFASEAAYAAVRAHFADPTRAVLRAGFIVGNRASARIQKRLGFKVCDANDRAQSLLLGEVDHIQTQLTREDWEARTGFYLHSERLILRDMKDADLPRLREIGGREEVAKNLCSVTNPWSVNAAKAWMNGAAFRGQIGFRVAICDRATGYMIGTIGLGGDYPSISYFIDPTWHGRGLATESSKLMIAYAFHRFDLEDVTADVFADNPASARVLEKLGFQMEGQDHATSPARVDAAPILLYRLTRDAYLG